MTPMDRPVSLVYHYGRLHLPGVLLALAPVQQHLSRMFGLFKEKAGAASWEQFTAKLYGLDVFLAIGCLERDGRAWEMIFAARAGRADRLLIDALRARAVRLYPRDEERQETAVGDFWSYLLVSETAGATPILARYDGQRPLIPWLIRIFQNRQISQLRSRENKLESLPEDDLAEESALPVDADARWHEAFCDAGREWLSQLDDDDVLLIGLRLRYRLSQREAANLLGVHEGTISRQITHIRDQSLTFISERLVAAGWTGDDLTEFIYREMEGLLQDEPRLFADYLARLLAKKGKKPSS